MKLFSRKDAAGVRPREHRALLVLLSIIFPAMVMVLALVGLRVVPFGDKHNLAITDAKYYLNGLMYFARLMRGQENFLYSFNSGLGLNEWGSISWGMLAPASLLSLFATLETIPAWFTWICVANVSLCGLTMYLMLAGLKGPKPSHLIFSTSYALIGFNVVNCYQMGFFHGVQLLPLMVLGLWRLLQGKGPWLYILSLAVCVFTNFYFGFSLCVASVLLFLAYMYVRREALRGRALGLFIKYSLSSLIAGLLAAPMWLPALKAFSGGGRLDQTEIAEYSFRENMPFIRIFSKLFTGANSTNELVVGMPNIFCGILVVALVVLYFIDRGVEVRRKRAIGAVLGVYLLGFYIPAFNLLMHGGTHTNWFPYRYSFVFSFLLICVAVEEFERLDALTLRDVRKCGVILLAAALLIFSVSYEFMVGGSVLLDFALLLVMGFGFWFYKTKPERAPFRVLSMFLLILVCLNQYFNFMISTHGVREWELDIEEYNKNIMVSGALTDTVRLTDDGFFRMEKDVSESASVGADPLLYDYNGVSHSGPTERMFVHQQLCRLGINWYDMRHWYSEGIPAATDDLLGLKYLISSRDLTEEKGYTKLITMQDTSLYKNENALPYAILSAEACQEIELGADVFENLNAVWKAMTGRDEDIFTRQEDITFTAVHAVADAPVNSAELADFFDDAGEEASDDKPEKVKKAGIEFSFVATKDGPVYRFDTSIPDSSRGLVTPAIHFCGVYRRGETVTGKMDVNGAQVVTDELLRGYCANLVFAVADSEVLETYSALLNAREVTFDVRRENDVTGAFTAGAGERMLFTIPWDEGWTCTIDGQPAAIDKTWDLFMSVKVPEGSHTYEMKFFPAWLNYGLYLCGAALLGLLAMMVYYARGRKERVK